MKSLLCNGGAVAAQDAEACRQLLEGLVGGGELGIARGLVLRRDCGPCFSMPGVAPLLADRLASDEGALQARLFCCFF